MNKLLLGVALFFFLRNSWVEDQSAIWLNEMITNVKLQMFV